MVKKTPFVIIAVILILVGTIVLGGCRSTTETATVTQTATTTQTSTTTQISATTTQTSTTTQISATTTTVTTMPTGTETPQYGGTLRFAHVFGPIVAGWPADSIFSFGPFTSIFFDTIVIEDDQGNVKPNLATHWQLSSDMKALNITLRKGVKFHDGSDWNAEVAKWNVDIQLEAKTAAYANVTSCEILDDYNIRLHLTKFTNTVYYALQTTWCVSKEAFDKNGEDWMRSNPVGTGPFKFDSWTPNVSIKGVRFDDYWGSKPYLDSVEMNQIPDVTTMAASFEAGENDIMGYDLDKTAYDLQQKGYLVYSNYISCWVLLPDAANADSPYADLKVRQAVNVAINRDAIVKSLGYGFWASIDEYALPGSLNYIEGLPANPYDPDEAMQLLADAGHPGGFTSSIVGDAFVSSKDAVTAIQGYLDKVGIKADITMADAPTIQNNLAKGWHNTLLGLPRSGIGSNWNVGLSMFSDADPTHVGVPKTVEYNKLYQDSITAPQYDPALVKKVVQYIYDNTLFIPIYAASTGYVVQPYVHDAGFFTRGHFWNWTPAKAWLSN